MARRNFSILSLSHFIKRLHFEDSHRCFKARQFVDLFRRPKQSRNPSKAEFKGIQHWITEPPPSTTKNWSGKACETLHNKDIRIIKALLGGAFGLTYFARFWLHPQFKLIRTAGWQHKQTVCGMGEVGISASQTFDLLPTERILLCKIPERRNRAYKDVFTARLRCCQPCRLCHRKHP